MNSIDAEIVAARKKMAEQFANVKLGGKGIPIITLQEPKRERLNQSTEQTQSQVTRKFNP